MGIGCKVVGETVLMMGLFTFFFGLVGMVTGNGIGIVVGVGIALLLDVIMLAQITGRIRRARARREWFRRTGFPGFF
jgi:hypothetical protein